MLYKITCGVEMLYAWLRWPGSGALYYLLSNPIYLGEIRHKGERYPGQHEPIVSRELWDVVQQRLRAKAVRRGEGLKTEAPQSPLAGKLFDENGDPLYVQGAAKGQRRYRYYVVSPEWAGGCGARVAAICARTRTIGLRRCPTGSRRPRCHRAGGRGVRRRRTSAAGSSEIRSSVD